MTKTILAEVVTRGSAIQKMTVALDDRVEPVANVWSKMLPGSVMTRHIAGLASTCKSLAQMNKSPDVDYATKER